MAIMTGCEDNTIVCYGEPEQHYCVYNESSHEVSVDGLSIAPMQTKRVSTDNNPFAGGSCNDRGDTVITKKLN